MKLEQDTPNLLKIIENGKRIGHIDVSHLDRIANIEYFNIYDAYFDDAKYDEALKHLEEYLLKDKKKKITVMSYADKENDFWKRNKYVKFGSTFEKTL